MTYSFTHIETESVFELSLGQIFQVRETLGISYDDLADLLTGYNCDSYADAVEELATSCNEVVDAIEYDEETYNRTRAYHRIMNGNQSDETCEESWLEAWEATAGV